MSGYLSLLLGIGLGIFLVFWLQNSKKRLEIKKAREEARSRQEMEESKAWEKDWKDRLLAYEKLKPSLLSPIFDEVEEKRKGKESNDDRFSA